MRSPLPRRVVVLAAVGLFTSLVACGKKGMPPECDQYLARYECWMNKVPGQNPADTTKTVSGMRQVWTDSSKTSVGRGAVLDACKKSQAEMESKFSASGCANAAPAAK